MIIWCDQRPFLSYKGIKLRLIIYRNNLCFNLIYLVLSYFLIFYFKERSCLQGTRFFNAKSKAIIDQIFRSYLCQQHWSAASARISAHGIKGCAIMISQCCDVLVKRKQSISVTKFKKNCHILRRLKIIFVCKIDSFINVCHISYFQRLKIEK